MKKTIANLAATIDRYLKEASVFHAQAANLFHIVYL